MALSSQPRVAAKTKCPAQAQVFDVAGAWDRDGGTGVCAILRGAMAHVMLSNDVSFDKKSWGVSFSIR